MNYKKLILKKLNENENGKTKQQLENQLREQKGKHAREKILIYIKNDSCGHPVYKDEVGNLWKRAENGDLYYCTDIEDEFGIKMRSDIFCRFIGGKK